jgi:hypothetical protein
MDHKSRYAVEPCPVCGKEDGARQGSTEWGHREMCCSPECGKAFGASPAYAALMLERATRKVAAALREQTEWQDALTARLEKERGGR